jgi:predicted metal-binding membrane protein
MLPITVPRARRAPIVAVGLVALAAWVVLVAWERSEFAGDVHHHAIDAAPLSGLGLFAVLVGGWAVMVAAMMLPTTMPLVGLFAGITASRANRRVLVGLLVAGYLAVWIGFGVLTSALVVGIHELTQSWPALEEHEWIIGAGFLAFAAAYQFSELKYRCLHECRSPRMFLIQRWHGDRERSDAFRIGVAHGVFCVGCCWTLMLVMLAIETFSLGWMLAIGAVMAAEKNFAWGRKLRTPLAIALDCGAIALLVTGIA